MSAIVAKLNHFRMSPRKVRLVADLVRGKDVDDAEAQLEHMRKHAALAIKKLLRSAIANAEHNFQKTRSALFIQTLTVDGGPTLKRFRARAFGRAADIHKRTSHITLVLGERSEALRKKRFVLPEAKKSKEATTLEDLSQEKKKPETGFSPKELRKEPRGGIQKKVADMGRKFFRRKSV